MKIGAENRKKTITLGVLSSVVVCGVLYNLFTLFGPSTPPPTVAPPTSAPAPVLHRPAGSSVATVGDRGAVPGVAAQRLATSSSSLDPTLDPTAMLRSESLVYAGSGRNIFSALYTTFAPSIILPRNVPSARPGSIQPVGATRSYGPPPVPPIPLTYFGTAQRGRGVKQAFLLSGEDVYVAAPGDIVARRFKVDQIMAFGVQITDLVNNVTQTLPLQQQ